MLRFFMGGTNCSFQQQIADFQMRGRHRLLQPEGGLIPVVAPLGSAVYALKNVELALRNKHMPVTLSYIKTAFS